MQVWITGVASPRGTARVAAEVEAAGWDGLLVVDSQNLSGDPYVALAMAATATTRLGLGTGVTNCVTRHAAATACSIASVDRISGGRAVLGIGRGDSALAHLGRAPARPKVFERYLRQLQTYLRGESVPFEDIDIPADVAPPLSGLALADAPPASRIDWIAGRGAKVPVEAAASGPTVIALAARDADRVMFALGADEERIAWGMGVARKAREAAGLDPAGITFGAYLNCGCSPDIDVARGLVKGGLTTFARFSVMHGTASGPVSEQDRAVLHKLHDAYDMKAHTRGDSAQAGTLTPDFIDRFAVVGSPDRCIERLKRLAALGLDKIAITGALRGVSETEAAASRALLEREVLPAVRS
ncbi:MAG: LLM class flavin-dependent oxidoreductase [Rhodopila sp.]|nr:LLM class flavin-dependent oxidoreductase [Rhodopila sp.]